MIKRKCKVCNKEYNCYPSTYNKKVYCSTHCRIKDTHVKSNCLTCEKEFTVAQSKYNSHSLLYKFCSKNCYNKYIDKKKEKSINKNTHICDNCGIEFIKYRKEKKLYKFCSVKCSSEYMKGEKSPFYKGVKINSGGYNTILINGKNFYLHRIVMEDFLGRKLSKNEDVHHKDGNKLNNDINNLEVIDKSEHGRLHANQRWNNA